MIGWDSCGKMNCSTVLKPVYIYFSVFEGELSETIPVIHTSIAGCRIVGRMTAGKVNAACFPNSAGGVAAADQFISQ